MKRSSILRAKSPRRRYQPVRAGDVAPGTWLNSHERKFGEKIVEIFRDIQGVVEMHTPEDCTLEDKHCVAMALAASLYCFDAQRNPDALSDDWQYRSSYLIYHGAMKKPS